MWGDRLRGVERMKSKRNSTNFIFLEICIILMYLFSFYETGMFEGAVSPFVYFFEIVMTLLTIASIVVCIRTSNRISKMDSLTEIGNVDWILAKGGKLHFQKKLSQYTAIFLNMKESKYVNERFGNTIGDKIIHDYAQDLKSFLNKKGYVGRMGGDNFFIFVKNDYLDEFIEHLKNVVFIINCDDEPVRRQVKVRCGIFRVTDDVGYREIINHTSTALAVAKENGPDFVEYEESMQKEFLAEKKILADFKQGLAKQEFVPYYQPKVDAKTGKLCGGEALVRWIKNGEVIAPGAFVSVLEKNNRITKLDFYIFEHMCKDIRAWIDAGLEPVRISSNFSKENLKNENFAEEIISIMNKYSLDGRYIEVELTESSCMEDFALLKQFSKKVKNAGITLAIDDFGTGYSSLSMLHEFDADVVKLDKSFLDSATAGSKRSKVFIQDIIGMVDDLEETTICEGVETKEQLDFLKEAGCNMIQGYYYDKPLPRDKFEERLKEPQYN